MKMTINKALTLVFICTFHNSNSAITFHYVCD